MTELQEPTVALLVNKNLIAEGAWARKSLSSILSNTVVGAISFDWRAAVKAQASDGDEVGHH